MRIHTLDLDFLHVAHAIAVFVAEGPDGLILIETGPHSTFPHLEAVLKKNGFSVQDFKHVFLSHIHFDHAGAAWAIAREGATIYVHPKGLPHLAHPEKIYNSARMIYQDQMDVLWGAMEPIPEVQLYAPQHGEQFSVGGLTLSAWYTPGHAIHHIAWQVTDVQESVLFTGDVAGVRIDRGPVQPPCPPPDINVEDWQASIKLLRELPVDALYLTHYGRIDAISEHLDTLERTLLSWAAWMRPHAEQKTPQEQLIEPFQQFVRQQLEAVGVDEAGYKQYEAANPAFMSVAGLMRYWTKKLG